METEAKLVKSAEGLVLALRDLVIRAGDGDLVGGKLESAAAYEGEKDPTSLFVSVGRRVYRVRVEVLPS